MFRILFFRDPDPDFFYNRDQDLGPDPGKKKLSVKGLLQTFGEHFIVSKKEDILVNIAFGLIFKIRWKSWQICRNSEFFIAKIQLLDPDPKRCFPRNMQQILPKNLDYFLKIFFINHFPAVDLNSWYGIQRHLAEKEINY